MIEAVVKEKGNSGYVELCQENITMFTNVYNKNYGKKINQLCSEIHMVLTGKALDEGKKEGDSNKEGIQQVQQKQTNTNNVIDMFGFGNDGENNNKNNGNVIQQDNVQQQVKKEKPQFGFIKKKQNATNANINTDVNITNVNEQDNIFGNTNVNQNTNNSDSNNNNLFDLISNQQQISPNAMEIPVQQNEQIQQQLPSKKSGFGFIKSKKQDIQLSPMNADNSSTQNINQQQQHSILNEQFNTLNINTPSNPQSQPQPQQQAPSTTNTNKIDMNLLNQLYNIPNQNQMQPQQQSQLHPQQQQNPNYVYMNYPPNMLPYMNPIQFQQPQMPMMQIPIQNIQMMPYYNNLPSMSPQQSSQGSYDTLFNPQLLSQSQQPISIIPPSSLPNSEPPQQQEEKPDPFGNLLDLLK